MSTAQLVDNAKDDQHKRVIHCCKKASSDAHYISLHTLSAKVLKKQKAHLPICQPRSVKHYDALSSNFGYQVTSSKGGARTVTSQWLILAVYHPWVALSENSMAFLFHTYKGKCIRLLLCINNLGVRRALLVAECYYISYCHFNEICPIS